MCLESVQPDGGHGWNASSLSGSRDRVRTKQRPMPFGGDFRADCKAIDQFGARVDSASWRQARVPADAMSAGTVHCSQQVSPHLEKISDSFTGNLTGMQCAFADLLFEVDRFDELQSICDQNVERIQRNYLHLLELTRYSNHVFLMRPHTGFHTMLFFSGLTTGSADSVPVQATE